MLVFSWRGSVVTYILTVTWEKRYLGLLTNTTWPVQSQKKTGGLKFQILVDYPCRENKGADQLRSYCVFVFAKAKGQFSHDVAHMSIHNKRQPFCNKVLYNMVLHQENMSVQSIPPQTPLLYSKTGVCRGITIFLIFAAKHRLWVLVRTASARRF